VAFFVALTVEFFLAAIVALVWIAAVAFLVALAEEFFLETTVALA